MTSRRASMPSSLSVSAPRCLAAKAEGAAPTLRRPAVPKAPAPIRRSKPSPHASPAAAVRPPRTQSAAAGAPSRMAADSVWRKWRREVHDILEVGGSAHPVGRVVNAFIVILILLNAAAFA